ncbi:MAG: ATP-binding protein [Candidatus Poribacteria bacterium]|nr:ATP-binding protein [Candidatus Poribacteria bacterium]
MTDRTITMKFDPKTIEHLGVQMYSTLPPVIAELVANAYDADAKNVKISLADNDQKEIVIEDDGHGMSFEDLEAKFLKIGRNRREGNQQDSESGTRKVIGKKGIGKLSFFGIANHVEVVTRRNGKENAFTLDWDEIKNSGSEYNAPVHKYNTTSPEGQPGTRIVLTKIRRKTSFQPKDLAVSLAKTFDVFDEQGFDVGIIHNEKPAVQVTNELKYDNLEIENHWDFPCDAVEFSYEYAERIRGKVISAKTTVPSSMKGIALFSRGKLVSNHEFYGEKASSHGYAYLTGWLNIDFIDDWEQDVIGTNRQSLNWENEETSKLRNYLQQAVKKIYAEQRRKKAESKKKAIKDLKGIDVDNWLQNLPGHERTLAKKITDQIIENEGIDTEKAESLLHYVQDAFQFEAFKEFANDVADTPEVNSSQFIELLKAWQLVEAKELYRLSIGRISTINKLSQHMQENSREVPTIHNFFKQFSWLLDPRIIEFKDEVSYSNLLKEKYPNEELEESNRRIDFICTSVSNNRFIIELKRPQHTINAKDIKQAAAYRAFLKNHIGNSLESASQVVAYIVGGKRSNDNFAQSEMETYSKSGEIYVKTYSELLENAKKYHQEFIEKYEQLQELGN